MFKRNDYIIISVICFFLGIFLISQFSTAKEFKRLTQPENNAVLAVEVSRLTKSNADLRVEVSDLTNNLESYRNSSESTKKAYDQYLSDTERYDIINGSKSKAGQGVVVTISGNLVTQQLVDLINAIKNMGAEVIEVNGNRLILNDDLSKYSGLDHFEIKVLGNSNLLKSAMERKGGIVEQISNKDIKFSIEEKDNLEVKSGSALKFNYARIVEETN